MPSSPCSHNSLSKEDSCALSHLLLKQYPSSPCSDVNLEENWFKNQAVSCDWSLLADMLAMQSLQVWLCLLKTPTYQSSILPPCSVGHVQKCTSQCFLLPTPELFLLVPSGLSGRCPNSCRCAAHFWHGVSLPERSFLHWGALQGSSLQWKLSSLRKWGYLGECGHLETGKNFYYPVVWYQIGTEKTNTTNLPMNWSPFLTQL